MAVIDKVQIEYERLKMLFVSVEQSKSELVDNLINEAAFMKVQLESLQNQIRKYGAVQISKKGAQRQTEAAKYYTKLVNAYGTVIKTLNTIMGKNIIDEDDEFDKFIGRMSE
jgi:pimeloyl-CoA synthetase